MYADRSAAGVPWMAASRISIMCSTVGDSQQRPPLVVRAIAQLAGHLGIGAAQLAEAIGGPARRAPAQVLEALGAVEPQRSTCSPAVRRRIGISRLRSASVSGKWPMSAIVLAAQVENRRGSFSSPTVRTT